MSKFRTLLTDFITSKKSKENETESDEISRNPVMDNPDARKDSRIGEECQKQSGETRSGEQRSGGELNEQEEKPKSQEDAVKEAYEKGLRDGRNSQIEELYFPKIDDGVPHFRGTVSKEPFSDIFSMARDA